MGTSVPPLTTAAAGHRFAEKLFPLRQDSGCERRVITAHRNARHSIVDNVVTFSPRSGLKGNGEGGTVFVGAGDL